MLTNCFRFAPRDSVPGLIAKICKYLKEHPGWSEEELEEQIKQFIGETGVDSFNGRTGAVVLNKDDVNNLKIASAYFAEGDESIGSLDLVSLYNQGVRFVFTDFNSATSGYNLTFALEYFSGSGNVVYYPMSTGSSGGGNIVSVNGKTGVVELSLADIIGSSGVQVKLCTAEEFTSTTTETWNEYYNEGYRIVGVVNSSATAIDYIYILKQDKNSHTPIRLSTGASDAYTPNNPPPYPVSSVNDKTGSVELKVVDVSKGNSTDENAYIFIDEDEEYPEVVATDSAKLGGQLPEHYATAQYVNQLKNDLATAPTAIYDTSSTTIFTLPLKRYGLFMNVLLVGGDSTQYILKIAFINSNNDVTLKDCGSTMPRSLSGSYDGETLTINSDRPVYGGLIAFAGRKMN